MKSTLSPFFTLLSCVCGVMVKRMVIGGQFTAGMASWAIVIFAIHINGFNDTFASDALRLQGSGLLVHCHAGVRFGGLGREHCAREQGEQGDFRK